MKLLGVTIIVVAALAFGAEAIAEEDDAALPPIDCPLHAAGVKVYGLRPFEEVEQYIAFLERSDRRVWQRPDEVVRALELEGDEVVADVGAGSGYFSFRLAEAVPRGTVRAIDIEPEMARHIHHQVLNRGISNLEVLLTDPDDPHVNEDVDLVFVCDVLHHVEGRRAWLDRLFGEMRTGARVVLIEFKEGELPEGPPVGLKIPKREILELMAAGGFRETGDRPDFLPYQHFLVFEKP
jgi:SAM-dependent methyltransferase